MAEGGGEGQPPPHALPGADVLSPRRAAPRGAMSAGGAPQVRAGPQGGGGQQLPLRPWGKGQSGTSSDRAPLWQSRAACCWGGWEEPLLRFHAATFWGGALLGFSQGLGSLLVLFSSSFRNTDTRGASLALCETFSFKLALLKVTAAAGAQAGLCVFCHLLSLHSCQATEEF